MAGEYIGAFDPSSASYVATVCETGTQGDNIGIVLWAQNTHKVKIVM